MTKRIAVLLLAALLMLAVPPAGAEGSSDVYVMALVSKTLNILDSEYAKDFWFRDGRSIVFGEAVDWGVTRDRVLAGNYERPAAAYLADMTEAEETSFSLWQKLIAPSELGFNSALDVETIFAHEGAAGQGLLVLLFDEGAPAILPWSASDGAVLMHGSFHPDETLAACGSERDVAAWIAAQTGAALPVTALSWSASLTDAQALPQNDGTDMVDTDHLIAMGRQMDDALEVSGNVLLEESERAAWMGHGDAPYMIVTADPGQNLLSMMLDVQYMREEPDVQQWLRRRYELQQVQTAMALKNLRTDLDNAAYDLNWRLTVTALHAQANVQGSGSAILLYEEAPPISIYWYAENGAVRLHGFHLPPEPFADCRTATDVSLAFMSAMTSMVFTELPLE